MLVYTCSNLGCKGIKDGNKCLGNSFRVSTENDNQAREIEMGMETKYRPPFWVQMKNEGMLNAGQHKILLGIEWSTEFSSHIYNMNMSDIRETK